MLGKHAASVARRLRRLAQVCQVWADRVRVSNRPHTSKPYEPPVRRPSNPPTPPWTRTYRYSQRWPARPGQPPQAFSEDAPMDDPATQRLWLRVDVILAAVIVIGLAALVVGYFT